MKITKQRIKEIIKEEMELASSKMDLKRKMKDFSDALADDKFKIEPAEAEEVDLMMTRILAAASAEEISTTDLRKANEYVAKYLNVDTITEDVLEEASPAAKRKIFLRNLLRKAVNRDPKDWENITKKFVDIFSNGTPEQINTYIEEIGDTSQEEEYIISVKDELKKGDFISTLPTTAETEAAKSSQDQDNEAKPAADPTEEQPQGPMTKYIDTDLMKTVQSRNKETYDGLLLFLQKLLAGNLIKESLVGLVRGLDLKGSQVATILKDIKNNDEKKYKAIIKFFSNAEYTEQFVKMINPDATIPTGDQEQPKADAKGVVELPSGDKAIPSQFDELVDVFKRFSDDDDGFMMKTYLVDQDKLLGELRSALRRFIGLEGQERAINEQEEPQPQAQPEDKSKGSRESLVKYVSRYRRDMNNTSKVMGEYLAAAQAGTYKAQPILNKLKIQLQRLQDDNAFIIRDLKALAGLKESLLLEEESREEKIANVRKAYDEIVNLLGTLLNTGTVAPEGKNKTKEPPAEEPAQEEQNEELVLEDIYLEQVGPSEEEMQTYVNAVKDALTAIDSIKGYFRLTGTFNRPLEEVKNDFVKYIQDYKETMSDLVSDLKSGIPTPEKADQYVKDFARLAKQIQDDFGVSPKEPIKTPEVTVNPEGAEDTTPAISPNTDAEAAEAPEAKPEVQPDFEDGPEADTSPRPDDITDVNVLTDFLFDNNSDYFKPSEMDRIFGRENADAFKGIRRLLLTLLYSKILQDRDEASADIPISDEPLQEKQRETDRQRLARFGQDAGYTSAIIRRFLKFIEGKNYKSKGRDGIETTPYIDLLNAITTLDDTKLKQVFSKLKQVEDDLKQADVAFNVDSSKIKQKIKSLMFATSSNTRRFAESKKHNNLLEKLIKQELKVLNGKKMVRN